MTLTDKVAERQQIEAEDYICNLSRAYVGYAKVYGAFVKELEQAINRAYDEKLDIHDIEYLSAICLALRRETVLMHRKFV